MADLAVCSLPSLSGEQDFRGAHFEEGHTDD